MKSRTIALIGILLSLATAPVLSAQSPSSQTIVVSNELVRKDGKPYLLHRVQEHQTLYGISKAYGVTLDDLYAANPGLMEQGPRVGSAILVPVSGTRVRTVSGERPAYREHTVMWYEDIEDIAALYNVSVRDIMEANGLRSKKVVKRQILRIPVKGAAPAAKAAPAAPQPEKPAVREEKPVQKQEKPVVREETPARKQEKAVAPPEIPVIGDPVIADPELAAPGEFKPVTVDKVAVRKADVLPPEIPVIGDPVIADPELAAPGEFKPVTVDKVAVRKADVLPPEIPVIGDPVIADPELAAPGEFKPVTVDKVAVRKADVLPPEIPVIADPVITDPELASTGTYRPLQVDPLTVLPAERKQEEEAPAAVAAEAAAPATETESLDGIFDWLFGKGKVEMALLLPFNAGGAASETNMDFYSGVLLALRDLEAEGVKTTLNVFDTQEGLPSSGELDKNDFILGPVSPKDLTSVLEITGGRIPVISPLDQRAASLADTHSGFIQAPSGASNQYSSLAAWAAEEAGKGDKVILVTEKTSGAAAPATGIREALQEQGVAFEGLSWTLSEGHSLPASLSAAVTRDGVNRIIVASEKEAFVGDVLRNLGLLQGRGYEIVMYAPAKVRNFETVDGSGYHQCELHICPSYFADYSSPDVQSFVRAYRTFCRTEPSQFAFQGYDLTRYFAGLCAKFGQRWTRVLGRETGTGLHTDFRFEKAGDGSFRNTGIRRVVFRSDYTTELVR